MEKYRIKKINLHLFDGTPNTVVTTDKGMKNDIKTYYSDYLIDNAEPELVHDQFGMKHPIPKNGGKTIEFRKYSPLGKATQPLVEGVTPDGTKIEMGVITAEIHQYGAYVTLSDILILTAIDNNIVQATELLGSQAGRTLDTITREILNGGSVVQYGDGTKTSRAQLSHADANKDTDRLTVTAVRKAVRTLKRMNAPKINGDYVGIIHPDVAYDLMSDPDWKYPHTYVDTENIYNNEIGKLHGVRFVESTEAKIWHGTEEPDYCADGESVYSTLILGAKAYGVTEVTGGGLTHIVKQLGSGGTTDPLDQRATVGWKATRAVERLVEEYMVRIETAAEANSAKN